jgi:hypothetical protein
MGRKRTFRASPRELICPLAGQRKLAAYVVTVVGNRGFGSRPLTLFNDLEGSLGGRLLRQWQRCAHFRQSG